jgi:hypothetical protein
MRPSAGLEENLKFATGNSKHDKAKKAQAEAVRVSINDVEQIDA